MRPIAKLKKQIMEQDKQLRLSDYLPTTFKGEGVLARAYREQEAKREQYWDYKNDK